MVNLTTFCLCRPAIASVRSLIPVHRASEQNFRQSLKLKFVAGKGGDGISEVNAIGGKGADIILQASRRVSSLQNVADKLRLKVVTASDGLPASKEMIVAPSIDNRIVKVPPGVEIYDEQEQLLASLDAHLHRFKVVRGGEGGCLENNFIGQHGETRSVVINAKLIADVGFVGFPNAGKSTLLRSISRAKPKIADYAFTTLTPNIGVVEFEGSSKKIKCTDLPGLIEGAHDNVGLGHEFLRHVERTKYLMLVIDVLGFHYSPETPYRSALDSLLLLFKELELYDPSLVEKPLVIVMTKLDKKGAKVKYKEFLLALKDVIKSQCKNVDPELRPTGLLQFQDIVPISSASGLNIPFLKSRLKRLVHEFDSNNRFPSSRRSSMLKIIDSKLEKIQYS